MVYLVLAVLSSASITVLMRISENYAHNKILILFSNYVVCSILAALFIDQWSFQFGNGLEVSVGLGLINGIFYLAGFVLLQKNINQNGTVMSSVFQKLGIVIPTLVSIFIFWEVPGTFQIVGLLLAISCVSILQMQQTNETVTKPFLLLFLLIFNGCGDAMSKVYESIGFSCYQNEFLLVTFLSAGLLCLLLLIHEKESFGLKDCLFGMIIGIPNFFSARFLLKALYTLPAIIVYPMYSVLTIVTVSAFGLIVFKEKLQKKQIFLFLCMLVSLILLNK